MPNQKKTDLEANLFHNSHPNLWTKTKSSKTFLDFFKNGDIGSVYTKTIREANSDLGLVSGFQISIQHL